MKYITAQVLARLEGKTMYQKYCSSCGLYAIFCRLDPLSLYKADGELCRHATNPERYKLTINSIKEARVI